MNTTSPLTMSAEIILTVAVGLAGTATVTREAFDVAPTAAISHPASPVQGLLVSATDTSPSYLDRNTLKIDSNRTDSRWHRYVSQRLRELRDGKFDFSDLQVPAPSTVERARFLANSTFRPEHPTPSVVPSEEGDVLYIWHKTGWDLEIDVGLEEISVWAHDRHSGEEWHGAFEEMRASVVTLLDFLAWHLSLRRV